MELRRASPRHAELSRRYEFAATLADFLLAVATVLGSALLLHEDFAISGTWILLIVAVLLGVRPTLRLAQEIHLMRLPVEGGRKAVGDDDGRDAAS